MESAERYCLKGRNRNEYKPMGFRGMLLLIQYSFPKLNFVNFTVVSPCSRLAKLDIVLKFMFIIVKVYRPYSE